jgi:hypothetical protein
MLRLDLGFTSRGGGIRIHDLFVPKQLGRRCCLGLVWLSPALMVR